MIVLLLVALVLTGFAFALAARAAAMPRTRSAATLDQIHAYGFRRPQRDDKAGGTLHGVVDSLAGRLGRVASGRLQKLSEAEIRRKLMAAGFYRISPQKFIGYRVLGVVGLPALWLWFSSTAGYSGAMVALGVALAVGAGWLGPMRFVSRRADRRFERVDYELPELIDLIVVTVEAGLSFSGSLQIAAERLHGPLGDELRLALQEQSMGLSTNEALRNMLDRCDTSLMRSFVRSVLQGETLGVSIGQIMRELATEMRKKRRQMAEERAQKAPIKILFPLVFLIFPALFVVLLGPAVFQFIDAFGG